MKDSERIDWLEIMANKKGGILLHSEFESTGRLGLGLKNTNRTLRKAIDQAAGNTREIPRRRGEKGMNDEQNQH